jgi:hypothetical protein
MGEATYELYVLSVQTAGSIMTQVSRLTINACTEASNGGPRAAPVEASRTGTSAKQPPVSFLTQDGHRRRPGDHREKGVVSRRLTTDTAPLFVHVRPVLYALRPSREIFLLIFTKIIVHKRLPPGESGLEIPPETPHGRIESQGEKIVQSSLWVPVLWTAIRWKGYLQPADRPGSRQRVVGLCFIRAETSG